MPMSYPEPRYHGDTGEANALYRPNGREHELTYPSGVTVDYLAVGASTDGEFGLYRWNFGSNETGPSPHFHRTISESFYIMSGTVRLYDGQRWVETGPGDYLYVPPGGIHGFKNVTGEPASMLILFTPGAPREEYFETLAELYGGKDLGDEERAEFYLRHDNHLV
jgi:mannose-6-phosphate isomerase-like protein (cupin superfamily)